MDDVRNKSALDALPAVLDLNVSAAHQLKDVPRQIHKRLWEERQSQKQIMKDCELIPQSLEGYAIFCDEAR